jgi:amino acid transporter
LTSTAGNQLILQPFAALGTTITYTLSVVALIYAYKKNKFPLKNQLIPWAALASCTIFIAFCIRSLLLTGILPLIGFGTLLLFGLLIYTNNNSKLCD